VKNRKEEKGRNNVGKNKEEVGMKKKAYNNMFVH